MSHAKANLQFARALVDAVTVQPFLAGLVSQRQRRVTRELELRTEHVERREAA